MGDRTATVVIETRSLMREALVSLMESHSYHVVCSVASAADIDRGSISGAAPALVIIGALPADSVAASTSSIRKLWKAAKIIVLFESASAGDLQTLLASEIDACIPLFVSPNALMGTLQLIISEDLRVVMMGDANSPRMPVSSRLADSDEVGQGQSLVVERSSAFAHSAAGARIESALACKNSREISVGGGTSHGLSEREEQILKALVRGHSNKVIARMCTVTEATVKVHMKSILRKIRVANRTQAAIWAVENRYFSDQLHQEPTAAQARLSSANGHGL